MLKDIRHFLIEWNNLFPLDKWWRDRYHVSFNSAEHQSANQADILMEYIEMKLHETHAETITERKRRNKLLKDGEWISENDVVEDDAFDKIVI